MGGYKGEVTNFTQRISELQRCRKESNRRDGIPTYGNNAQIL
jgi:uracil-DNA glycosylase